MALQHLRPSETSNLMNTSTHPCSSEALKTYSRRTFGLGALITLLGWSGLANATPIQWGSTPLPMIGEPAPEVELPDETGQIRRLSDYRGSWIVLYFYPQDFTSGCTIEARRFQQDLLQYEALNAQILGVSADSVDSHRRFCDREGLRFPLLSDPSGLAIRTYGSWGGRGALRNTFLINPEGVLAEIFPIVSPSLHSAELLDYLRAAGSAG